MAKRASSKQPGKRGRRAARGPKSVHHKAGSKKTLKESVKGDEKRSRRKAQAARDQYQQNPPSTEQLEFIIVTLIREAQKPLAERKGQTGAEGTRDIVQLAAEVLEERGPILGASMEEIIWAVHKEFPGTPWSRIRNVVLSLEKEGQIHLDHEESQRRGVRVWRIGRRADTGAKNKAGKQRHRGKVPKRLEPTRRQRQALSLHERRFTFQQIGEELGITKQAAEQLVKRGLANRRPSGRSVATQALPTGHSGQMTTVIRKRPRAKHDD